MAEPTPQQQLEAANALLAELRGIDTGAGGDNGNKKLSLPELLKFSMQKHPDYTPEQIYNDLVAIDAYKTLRSVWKSATQTMDDGTKVTPSMFKAAQTAEANALRRINALLGDEPDRISGLLQRNKHQIADSVQRAQDAEADQRLATNEENAVAEQQRQLAAQLAAQLPPALHTTPEVARLLSATAKGQAVPETQTFVEGLQKHTPLAPQSNALTPAQQQELQAVRTALAEYKIDIKESPTLCGVAQTLPKEAGLDTAKICKR